MKRANTTREKILNQTSYWVEGLNGGLYDAIAAYMEEHKLNRSKMAEHLGITRGRMSQILNEGDINFSYEKIVDVSLKIGKFPVIEFVDKQKYLKQETEIKEAITKTMDVNKDFATFHFKDSQREKVINLRRGYTGKIQIEL